MSEPLASPTAAPTAAPAAPAVEVRGVDKVFETRTGQVQALDAIDLTVAAGSVALLGVLLKNYRRGEETA